MYLREIHAEHDLPILHTFIRENPLGIFTTAIESPLYPLIQSSHIPWVLDFKDSTKDDVTTNLGILRGHIARANPQTKAMLDSLDKLDDLRSASSQANNTGPQKLEKQVMVLFNSPIHHYVTPKFYAETKPQTGKVVPTWNYAAVQVYGEATIYYQSGDEKTSLFLDEQIEDLSNQGERNVMDIMRNVNGANEEELWKVSDAPPRYVELLKKGIVGVEIKIQNIGGKFKMSQEVSQADREGVIEGFRSMGNETADKLADVVKERGALADAKKS